MIKVNELRIGNYVHAYISNTHLNVVGIEERINTFVVTLRDFTGGYTAFLKLEDINPIPLTEKWLQAFGFRDSIIKDDEHGFTRFYKSGLYFERFNNEDFFVCDNLDQMFGSMDIHNIKHVHQLQNLYFALTGEELTLKP